MLQAAYSPQLLSEEMRRTEAWLEPFFEDWDDDMARYYGPGWRKETSQDLFDPENFAQEWMSLMAPQCTLGNPRVKVKTSRGGSTQDRAKGNEFALNRWITATRARNLNEKLVADYGFRWAVVLVLPAEEGELIKEREDPRGWPVAKRISPRRFLWDPLAAEKEECRWIGHKVIYDKDDLLARARDEPDEEWNIEAIRFLTENEGLAELRTTEKNDAVADRDEVIVYNVWVPEYEPTKADKKRYGKEWDAYGVHGAWLTLGRLQDDETGQFLRPAYPNKGRRAGPYTWFGTYVIPDEPGTLAPIPAVKGQDEEYNDHARALSRAMSVYKKGILVDGTDPDWEEKIREFEDHWVVALEGLDNITQKVKEIELGGATEMHMVHQNILRERRNRASGITDAARGSPRAGVTATAEAVSDQKDTTRTGWVVHKFRDGVADYLESVSWHLDHDDRVVMELGPEAAGHWVDALTGEPEEQIFWKGGFDEAEIKRLGDPWDAMGFVIEPYSMETTSDGLQQKRAVETIQVVAQLAPLMAQFPFVHWDQLIDQFGEQMNLSGLGDNFDMEMLAQYQELALQLAMQPDGGKRTAQPRLAMDTGPGLTSTLQGLLPGAMTGATQSAGRTVA